MYVGHNYNRHLFKVLIMNYLHIDLYNISLIPHIIHPNQMPFTHKDKFNHTMEKTEMSLMSSKYEIQFRSCFRGVRSLASFITSNEQLL